MSLGAQIGRRVREERDKADLTMWVLAQRCGIDPGYISKLERGEIDNPGVETLAKIFPVLGMSADEFVLPSVPAEATH